MLSLNLTIKPIVNHSRKILVELNADKFERLAADLGFFSSDFLKSLDQAERVYKAGRTTKIKSLKELRK